MPSLLRFILVFCSLPSNRGVLGFVIQVQDRPSTNNRHGYRRSSFLCLSVSDNENTMNHLEIGTDPIVYRLEDKDNIEITLANSIRNATTNFYETGYCIIDHVLPLDDVLLLDKCFSLLESGGSLQKTPEAADGIRDDCIRFNSEVEAMIPVRRAIRLLKGVADTMMPVVSEHYYGAETESEKQEEPLSPATKERPLTVPQNVMIASYPNQGRYRIHSDNSFDTDLGRRLNWREITCILYVNPNWTEEDGGKLRLWPESQDIAAEQFGTTDEDDEQQLRQHLKQQWIEKHPQHEQEYVEVEPIAGRMILFESHLLHEVRPSLAETRRAVTCWFNRPRKVI